MAEAARISQSCLENTLACRPSVCFAWSVGIFGVVGLFMGPAGTSFTRVTEEHLSSSLSPASLGEEPWGWASPGVLYPA